MGFFSAVKRTAKKAYKATDAAAAGFLPGGATRTEAAETREGWVRTVAPKIGAHPDGRIADFFVGVNRIQTGTIGQGGNPTVKEAWNTTLGPAAKKLPDQLNNGLEGLTEALAEALAAAGEGTTRGLIKGAGPFLLLAGAGAAVVYVAKERLT